MTLLSVVRDVAAVVGVAQPSSVFSGITSNRTMAEMLSLANESAQRIAYNQREWSKLKKTVTYTGDGTTTAFNLPADYKRMLLTGNVWRSTSQIQPMTFIPDTDQWLNRRAGYLGGVPGAWGEWTMYGGQIHIFPAMSASETAYFAYLHKNCVALLSGGLGDVFQNDADAFVLNERLQKLDMIWQWLAQKGAPYQEHMNNYTDALSYEMGTDGPAPILVGRMPISSSANVAYPWMAPTP